MAANMLPMARSHARLVGPAGFTRDLLAGGASAAVPLPLTRVPAPGGSPRIEYMADALRKDALAWLFGRQGGGWQELKIVTAGRRRELRLWDERVFKGLEVRFSERPLQLLVAALESRWSPPPLPPSLVQADQASIETGDLIALHQLANRLLRLARGPELPRCSTCAAAFDLPGKPAGKATDKAAKPTPKSRKRTTCPGCGVKLAKSDTKLPSPRADRIRALLELSPLTQLFRSSEGERDVPELKEALGPLLLGERPVLFSYLAGTLAKGWLKEEQTRRRMSAERSQASYLQSARTFEAFVSLCSARPDALRPLIEFYRGYVLRYGGRAPVTESLREQSRTFDRVSERDGFLRTASRLFVPGQAIQAAVDLALATPFVDRTEAQKVLLSEYHESYRGEVAAEVEAIRRELAGEVG